MRSARKKVVFDTSSLIPACLNPDHEPAQILRRALLEHDVFTSAEAFNELALVLSRDKFNAWRPIEHRLIWMRLFRDAVFFVETDISVTECRDPKDNKFLDLALYAKADILVSSDIHLLEMHPFRGVHILQLAGFKQQVLEPGRSPWMHGSPPREGASGPSPKDFCEARTETRLPSFRESHVAEDRGDPRVQ